MKKLILQGTFTALVTPFNTSGEVDFEKIKKLIDFQIENGAEGIVVCGSTGESATLTSKEKSAIIITAVEHSAGRVPIIAGTGSNETQMALSYSILAKEHGADALLMVAPYYNKPTQQGLFEHFKLIADRADIPIILYNVPGRTAINMLPETVLKIAEKCPNVIAIKEASGDLTQMMQIIKYAPDNFTLLSGDDDLLIPVISIGGKGVISTISNYVPKQFSDLVRLALKGKFKDAAKLHYSLFELMQLNFIESNPIPCKYAMSLMNLIEEVYRLPLLKMTSANKKKMKAALNDAGII